MSKPLSVSDALMETLISPNEHNTNLEAANVVDGLFAIARALNDVAKSLRELGVNDAATPMGAVEMLAKEVKDGADRLSYAILQTHDET